MRGGDDAHIAFVLQRAAHALENAFLQHAQQLHLHRQAHVADLVEEQRAALGQLEPALARRDGAGEGALLVAKQLAFQQVRRYRAAVHRDERPVATRTGLVDRPRDHFLAGTRLAQDQDAGIVLRDLRDEGLDLLDGAGAAGRAAMGGNSSQYFLF